MPRHQGGRRDHGDPGSPGGELAREERVEAAAVEVIEETEAWKVVPSLGAPSVNVTVFVPVAVPPIVTSADVNVVTSIGSLKVTVKRIGPAFAGSAWVAAWLTVTVGAWRSIVKVALFSGLGVRTFEEPSSSVATARRT